MGICPQVIPWSWALTFFSWTVWESPSSGGCGGQQSKMRLIRSLIWAHFGLTTFSASHTFYLHLTFPASTFWPLLSLLTSHTILASHSFSVSAFSIGLPPFLSLHFSFWGSSFWFSLRPQHRIFKPPSRLWICKFSFQTTTFHLDMSIHTFSVPQLTRNNPCPSWHLAARTTWVYVQGNLVVLSVIPSC